MIKNMFSVSCFRFQSKSSARTSQQSFTFSFSPVSPLSIACTGLTHSIGLNPMLAGVLRIAGWASILEFFVRFLTVFPI